MKFIKFYPLYLFSLLPLPLLYLVSDIAFFFTYYLLKYRRKVVRGNLQNAFPNKSLPEIIRIEKTFFRHFCDVLFELIKTLTISKKTVFKNFSVKNSTLVEHYYKEKKDIILYGGHLGNWELTSHLPLFFPYQVTAFYQQLSNNYFNELMLLIRSRFGLVCIESKKGYKTLSKFRDENVLTMSMIVGDQNPRKNSSKYWTTFLNQETAFLVGADRIAKKMNQVVIFPLIKKIKRGVYEMELILIDENSKQRKGEEIIEKYIRILEEQINKTPELWLWSHRRWKLKKPQDQPL